MRSQHSPLLIRWISIAGSACLGAALTACAPGGVPATGGASGGAAVADAGPIVSESYSSATLTGVDLNDDGMTDVIAKAEYESGLCGIRACSHMVLINTGSDFRVVNDDILAIELRPLASTTGRYHDLLSIGHDFDEYTWLWTGSRYD
jgi:hypothetical protein